MIGIKQRIHYWHLETEELWFKLELMKLEDFRNSLVNVPLPRMPL